MTVHNWMPRRRAKAQARKTLVRDCKNRAPRRAKADNPRLVSRSQGKPQKEQATQRMPKKPAKKPRGTTDPEPTQLAVAMSSTLLV